MKRIGFLLSLNLLIFPMFLFAQNPTVGLVYKANGVTTGYTLFTPEQNQNVFLIDNCGEVVHSWTFSEKPGLTCYLLPNGNLLRSGKDSLEIRDWNNNQIWAYSTNANGILKHHDIEPLPNGNILLVAKDIYTKTQTIGLGGDTLLSVDGRNFEKIIELQPIGTNQAAIVWEWKFKDHLVQEYDATKPNYGVVANHPELLEMNFDNGFTDDYVHLNAIDYNAQLDQIMITARHLSELFIIDHSTTTLQAASHAGGTSNKGGDFLWRWGNPQINQAGGTSDQKLFWPHDGKWVESTYLDSGKISVFNNRGDGSNTFSSIHLIEPQLVNSVYQIGTSGGFLPSTFNWTWTGNIFGTAFYESKKSGTHALPNGNMMICENGRGRISEVTKAGQVIWVYVNPSAQTINSQYGDPLALDNFIFRAEKYLPDFPGLVGKDLTPQGIIENVNPLSDQCASTSGISEIAKSKNWFVQPSLNGKIKFFEWENFNRIEIFDAYGKSVYVATDFSGQELQVQLAEGIYYLVIENKGEFHSLKLVNLN